MLVLSNKKVLGKIIIIMIAFLIAAPISHAVSVKKKRFKECNYYKSVNNQFALSLTFDNDISDDIFRGLSISGISHYNSNGAVRFNLGLGHPLRDYYNNDNIFYSDGHFLNDLDDNESYELRLSVQHMYYPARNNFLNFYWGLGPIITLHHTESEYTAIYGDNYSGWFEYRTKDKYRSIAAGGIASLGLEMYLSPNFSLLGEYEFSLQHEWAEVVYDDVLYPDDNLIGTFTYHDQHNFTTSQFKLGLSFHF